MTELNFEQVDQIQAATGDNHYYRVFQIEEESWIVYIHQFDQLQAARGFRPDPLVYTTSSFEMAQTFAQAFEDDAAEGNTPKRLARATQVACGILPPDWTRQGMTAAEWNAAGRPGWVTNNPEAES